MGVDHRGRHVLVAEKLLHSADVVPVIQEVGGEGVAYVWQVILFASFARSAAFLTAFCTTVP